MCFIVKKHQEIKPGRPNNCICTSTTNNPFSGNTKKQRNQNETNFQETSGCLDNIGILHMCLHTNTNTNKPKAKQRNNKKRNLVASTTLESSTSFSTVGTVTAAMLLAGASLLPKILLYFYLNIISCNF